MLQTIPIKNSAPPNNFDLLFKARTLIERAINAPTTYHKHQYLRAAIEILDKVEFLP